MVVVEPLKHCSASGLLLLDRLVSPRVSSLVAGNGWGCSNKLSLLFEISSERLHERDCENKPIRADSDRTRAVEWRRHSSGQSRARDRKSTRLNSSHVSISSAV